MHPHPPRPPPLPHPIPNDVPETPLGKLIPNPSNYFCAPVHNPPLTTRSFPFHHHHSAQFTYNPAGGQGWVSSDILKFAIFSRDLSPNDEDATGDELNEPVLYFYPSDISPHDRIKFMNTVLGLGDFMRNFSTTDKITSVHFDQSRIAIYECEPNIYFVLEVSSPQRRLNEEEREARDLANDTNPGNNDDDHDVLHASDEGKVDVLLGTLHSLLILLY